MPRFELREEPKVKSVRRTDFRESVGATFDRRCRSDDGAEVTRKHMPSDGSPYATISEHSTTFFVVDTLVSS